jgi:serine/threonine-protein kinase HipA
MASREPLGVWLNDTKVAEFTERGPTIRCRYLVENLPEVPMQSPVLSCSLPLGGGRLNATNFATGLLPEGQHRMAMANLAGVPARDTFGLLARFGRDVAGALVIGRESPSQHIGSALPYTSAGLNEEVAGIAERPLGLYDDSELSLPGLQNKLLLVRLPDGTWARPVHGEPSTHILKVDDPRHPGLVAAETDCLRIAHDLGLTSIQPDLVDLGGTMCLIVERFDRRFEDGHLVRVHQEDACQALDRDPDANRGRGKYEDAGGPSLAEIAGLLETWSSDSLEQRTRLLRAATLNVVVGNADAHGKNLALLHPTMTSLELAPLYDVVPTVLWENLRQDMAMSVNGRSHVRRIDANDLVAEALRWHMTERDALKVVSETVEAARDASQRLEGETGVREFVRSRSEELLHSVPRSGAGASTSKGTGQRRVSRGTRSGGQFVANTNPESQVEPD